MNDKQGFKHITLPISAEAAATLTAGDYVMLNGAMYTARDAAHKRMAGCLAADEPLPVDLSGETVYYVGPCFDKNGNPKGAGPTTSGRMDAYAPALYDAIKRNGALYLCAIGGAGALYAKAMVSVHTAAYGDLGTEAIRRMEVRDFPVIVGIDQHGNSIFAK